MLDILALVAVLFIGLVNLAYPFAGDQALFAIGARELSSGAVLYRDFWDIKQPAIYGFYLIAGKLFGFSEIGIHTFELLYWLTFSVVLVRVLKPHFTNHAMSSISPLLIVGMYYALSPSSTRTQIEALVGFPLFLALWFAWEFQNTPRRLAMLFLSGLMGGVVLLFKFMFLPILAAFWITTLARVARDQPSIGGFMRIGAALSLGMAIPLMAVAAYFASHHAFALLWWTSFVLPPRIFASVRGQPTSHLVDAIQQFVKNYSSLLLLGVIAAFDSLGAKDSFKFNLILWCVIGIGIIFAARQFWWLYYFQLLSVPIGILAAFGMDRAWEVIKRAHWPAAPWRYGFAAAMVLLLFAPALRSLYWETLILARHGFALRSEERLHYQESINPFYTVIERNIGFLSTPDSRAGNIYVLGSPLYYWLSHHRQAIALNGWSPWLFVPEQWRELTRQLSVSQPRYIFVQGSTNTLISQRSPRSARFLSSYYRVLFKDPAAGTWYVHK